MVKAKLDVNTSELVEVLASNKHIQHLDVSWNGIASNNMLKILEVLATNRKLKFLNLSANGIGK